MTSEALPSAVAAAQARADVALIEYDRRVALKASLPVETGRAAQRVATCLAEAQKAEAALVLAGEGEHPELTKAAKVAGDNLDKARTAHARLTNAAAGIDAGITEAESAVLAASDALQPLYRQAHHDALSAYAQEFEEAAAAFAATMRRGYALSAALGHALRSYLGAVVIPGIPPHIASHLLDHDRLRMADGGTIDLMEAWRRDASATGLHDKYRALHTTAEKLKQHAQRVQDRDRAAELRAAWDAPPKPQSFPPPEPLPPLTGPRFEPKSWTVREPGTTELAPVLAGSAGA